MTPDNLAEIYKLLQLYAPLSEQSGLESELLRNSLQVQNGGPRRRESLGSIEVENEKELRWPRSRQAKTAGRKETITAVEGIMMENSSSEEEDSDDSFIPDSASEDCTSDVDYRVISKSRRRKPRPKVSPKKAALEAKKALRSNKTLFAEALLNIFDDMITRGKVARRTASTGGVKIVWSERLTATAGYTDWKSERIKTKGQDGVKTTYKHYITIVLADQLITNVDRLIKTIGHEYCHVVDFVTSGGKGRPHGKRFTAWATQVRNAFGIEVTTTHDYEIETKPIVRMMHLSIRQRFVEWFGSESSRMAHKDVMLFFVGMYNEQGSSECAMEVGLDDLAKAMESVTLKE